MIRVNGHRLISCTVSQIFSACFRAELPRNFIMIFVTVYISRQTSSAIIPIPMIPAETAISVCPSFRYFTTILAVRNTQNTASMTARAVKLSIPADCSRISPSAAMPMTRLNFFSSISVYFHRSGINAPDVFKLLESDPVLSFLISGRISDKE